MRIVVLLFFSIMITSCAMHREASELTPGEKTQIESFRKAYYKCMFTRAVEIDDLVTNPLVMADIVAPSCSGKLDEFYSYARSLNLDPWYCVGMKNGVQSGARTFTAQTLLEFRRDMKEAAPPQ